jgi:NitT/TauT family transport system substrate-binding protein
MRTLRRARLLLVALCAVCMLPFASPSLAQTTKLNIGYPPANDFVPAFVAKDQGFFAKRGLDVTFIQQRVVSTIPVALSSGALDIGGLPPGVLLGAREGGLDLVSISGISRNQRRNPIISLLAMKTSTIHGASDLQGKKIGVPGLYGGLDIILRQWLLDKKIPLSSITFVELPFPSMGDMLARNQVDAVAIIEPQRSRILATGNVNDIADYYSDLVDDVSLITYGTTRAWADAHRDTIVRFKAALAEAEAYMVRNPDQAKAASVKYLGFSGPTGAFSPRLTTDDFLFYANAMRAIGLLKQPIDFSTLIYR